MIKMDNINPIIHQPTRLQILTLVHMDKSISFSTLKKELWLSDGNLGMHLEKLESAGYISIEKSFVEKKPLSTIRIEKKWEMELLGYMNALERIFKTLKK